MGKLYKIMLIFGIPGAKWMLVPIKTVENNIMPNNVEITGSSFKDLNLKEGNNEEFLRKNIEVIFGDKETLLIVG